MIAALDSDDVAELLRMKQREPRSRRRAVVDLARAGRIPAPIDPTLPVHLWRWSPASLEAYIAGEWKATSGVIRSIAVAS